MSYLGIAIYPDKRVQEVTFDRETGLEAKQKIVEGWIEAVALSDGSTMYVNEEFSYQFTAEDVNWMASDIAGVMGRQQFLFNPILGPVVIVGPVDEEGWDTGITEKARKAVERVSREAGGIDA